MTDVEKKERLVKLCLMDVSYMLTIHCPRFGLDQSEMFDNLKEELKEEFEKNVDHVYGKVS